MKPLYYLGRIVQVFSLLIMPSAIWAAEFRHSEREALGIFLGSTAIFFIGFGLSRIR